MTTPTQRKNQIRKLLKGIETADPAAAAVVNESKYIQHNPQTQEGSEGLTALFARLSKTNPRVNIVRAFADGDFVFALTEYDFASRRIGFEVFRFDGDLAVEHWDNIQPRRGPNPSGRTMVDGPTTPPVSEGTRAGTPTAFYDLYRLKNAKVVEHWDTTEPVPPKSEWKNNNGKF